jgi:NAD(P)-dependent dehydrogenase (short-subunit alcohol dehydrogenase family)
LRRPAVSQSGQAPQSHHELSFASVSDASRWVISFAGSSRADVSNLGDLDRLFAQIKQEKGKLDIVFANAGAAKLIPFGE